MISVAPSPKLPSGIVAIGSPASSGGSPDNAATGATSSRQKPRTGARNTATPSHRETWDHDGCRVLTPDQPNVNGPLARRCRDLLLDRGHDIAALVATLDRPDDGSSTHLVD